MTLDTPMFARDMDLVREILIWMERGAPREQRPSPDDNRRFAYHCLLMKQADMIDAAIAERPAGRGSILMIPEDAVVRRLLWKGQEALAAMRSDTVWKATKDKIGEHGLPMIFDFVLSCAKGIAVAKGLPLA